VLTEDDEIEDLLAALGDAERREKRENQNKTLAKSARPEQPAPGSAAISSLPQPPAAAEARRAISQAHPAGMSAPAGIPAPAAGASAASASLPPDATWNRGGLPPAPPSTPSDEPEEMLGDEAIADLISASALPAAPPSSSPPPAVEGAASGQPPQLSAAGDKAAPPPLPPEVAWDSGSRPLPASPSPPGADNKQTLGDEANADLIGAASAVTPSASSASEVELAAAGPQPPLAEGATPAASPPLAAEDELADLLTAAAAPPSLAAAKTLTMPRLEETRSAQNQEVASAAEQQAATAGEDQKAEAKHRDTMALLEQGLLATSSPGEKSGAEPGKSGAAASKAEAPAAAAATPAAASAAEDLIALLENRAASPSAVGTSVFSAPGAPAAQKDPADTAAGKLQRLLDAIAWRENWALYCDLLAALIFTLSLAVIISHFLWHPPPVP
ncbi:MAG: hypothetical protein N3A66_07190, partial [Planctomycetota bacterium]|nr:hypothetical protein [Planctomycetota bacterium]